MSKEYIWNDNEELYFSMFFARLTDEEKKHIELKRLSTGAIEPYYNNSPLGKIKLQGRKYYLQVFKTLLKHDVIEGTNVNEFITYINDVIKYMRRYCKD